MKLYREIEKSFPKIEKLFTEATLMEFTQTPENNLEKYNFGLGTMLRLKLLRPQSTLYKTFAKCGYTDKDEMAMEIIKAFHKEKAENPAQACQLSCKTRKSSG